jgi:glutamate N-acetyltransferase/amino-acid N-acetyltransferase
MIDIREHEHPIVGSPLQTRFFSLPEGVRLVEPEGVSPGVTYPAGFLASGIVAGLKQSGRPDMGVLAVAPEYRDSAASATVSTTNAFAAAPVVITRDETEPGGLVALVINSGNANACTGPLGLEVARAMQRACAHALSAPVRRVAVGSTGIIGVQLNAGFMADATQKAAGAVSSEGGIAFARAIMTTDRFAKQCALEVDLPQGTVRLAACGKGAGMIAPAMATMLCAVTTDAHLMPDAARMLLDDAVGHTFNKVTVDGEMSTNDSVYFLASGASGVPVDDAGRALFAAALKALLLRIALMMVADGEGATKIMRVEVVGADNDECAARVCRAIADSPLVKTAMHGGDPNWGRVISSAGAALPGRSLPHARLHLCGIQVVEDGAARAVPQPEWVRLVEGMRAPEIDIRLDLGLADGAADLFFADLGHEYITINAEYHS